jgi:hypothetical protein
LEIQYKYLSCLPPFAIEGVGMRGFYIWGNINSWLWALVGIERTDGI